MNNMRRNDRNEGPASRGCFFLTFISSLIIIIGCQNPTDTTQLKVDRDIPPSANYDASYGFWGPDGTTIYFTHSEKLGSNPDPGQLDQLWKLNLATGQRAMIHTGRILNADISPDGKWFVFHSFTSPEYLYKMRSDGTALQKLTGPGSPNPDWEYTITGKWSHDGSQILFARYAGVPRGISLMDREGTNPRIIVPFGVSPNWSPQANKIIYVDFDTTKTQRNQRQIYIGNPKGSDRQRITDLKNTTKLSYPSFSPNGNRIAFILDEEVHIMETDGVNIEQITEGPGYTKRPEWSPDGKTILFSRIIPNVSKRLYYLDVAAHQVTPVFPAAKKRQSQVKDGL